MTQMAGQDYSSPSSSGNNFATAKPAVYSFYGTVGGESGAKIETPFGFYLPNVNQELTIATDYSMCENEETSSECADFYISSEGYYRVKSQLKPATTIDGVEIPGVEPSEEQKKFIECKKFFHTVTILARCVDGYRTVGVDCIDPRARRTRADAIRPYERRAIFLPQSGQSGLASSPRTISSSPLKQSNLISSLP